MIKKYPKNLKDDQAVRVNKQMWQGHWGKSNIKKIISKNRKQISKKLFKIASKTSKCIGRK